MIKSQIADVLTAYASCFSDLDADSICQFWLAPAVISVGPKLTYFATHEDLKCNVGALCRFYRNQGVKKAEVSVVSCVPVMTDCVHLSADYKLYDEAGKGINQWTHHYVLRCLSDDWRFVFAIADEETLAWEKRGTPIG